MFSASERASTPVRSDEFEQLLNCEVTRRRRPHRCPCRAFEFLQPRQQSSRERDNRQVLNDGVRRPGRMLAAFRRCELAAPLQLKDIWRFLRFCPTRRTEGDSIGGCAVVVMRPLRLSTRHFHRLKPSRISDEFEQPGFVVSVENDEVFTARNPDIVVRVANKPFADRGFVGSGQVGPPLEESALAV